MFNFTCSVSLKRGCLRYLSKTSQIIFDLHPGFSHMEDEKGNKLHLFKKYFKMMCFTIQAIIGPYCNSF